jgi:excisionase family DNA binding protein
LQTFFADPGEFRPARPLVYPLNWFQFVSIRIGGLVDHADPEDSFLTVADVAETLKLNQQTVRNWIDQGSLPAVRVGRRVRIKRSDFERVLDEGYTGASGSGAQQVGPTAEDFWGGEAVGLAESAVALRNDSNGTARPDEPTRRGDEPIPRSDEPIRRGDEPIPSGDDQLGTTA